MARKKGFILVVEDNPGDVFLIREAIENAGITTEIHVVTNGQAAVRFFDAGDGSEEASCPGLVILDINLPIKRGDEVLRHIRSSAQCHDAPVLIVSTSGSEVDRAKMKQLGCDGYFRKPSTHAEFMQLGPIVKAMLDGPV